MTELEIRFWSNVKVCELWQCWIWCGRKGRGTQFWLNGKYERIARVAWFLNDGQMPEGFYVLHECDNPKCVNPFHLWLGTHRENMLDMVQKGRQDSRLGERNTRAKLTERQVQLIRNGLPQHGKVEWMRRCARVFDVSFYTVKSVVYRENWVHV